MRVLSLINERGEIKCDVPIYETHKLVLAGVDCANQKEYIYFAIDIKTTGQKAFFKIKIEGNMQILPLCLMYDIHGYEWIMEHTKVKPFFDLEMEGSEFTNEESKLRLDIFIGFLCREMNQIFNTNITIQNIIILNSNREGKLSYHLIINHNIYFENLRSHRDFMVWLKYKFMNPNGSDEERIEREKLTWERMRKNRIEETLFIFDMTVYDKNQNIRCINQTKMGKEYRLVNESNTGRVIDTLIGLYESVENMRPLNVDGLQYEIKEIIKMKKSVEKKKPRVTLDKSLTEETPDDFIDGYKITGETLMSKSKEKYVDLNKYETFEQYIRLIPNTSQTREFYLKMRYMIHQVGGDKQDFIEWWKLSSTFDNEITRETKIFDSKPNPDYNSGIGFLRKYAKISHPDFFKIQNSLLNDYYHPNFGTIETRIETSQYVSQEGTEFEDNILTEHKIVIVKADLGAGKTTAIKRVILNSESILIISPRIAYTRHAVKEFKVSSYLDGDCDLPKLACSMESLWKIPDTRLYEYVILDEVEAILSIFSSVTIQGKQLNVFNKLKRIIGNSKKTIVAGAFITQKTIDFVESFNTKTLLIRNDRITTRKNAIEIDPNGFDEQLIRYLSIKDNKPYVYFDTKKDALTFISKLQGAMINNDHLKMVYQKHISYSSVADDNVFNGLDDINNVWDRASFIMATPSITVGNSYSPKETTFTSVWIKSFPSCIVADTIQGHKRVRHTKTGNVYFSIPEENVLTSINNCRGDTIASLGAFDAMTDIKRELISSYATKQMNKFKKLGEQNKMSSEKYNAIIIAMTKEYEQTPEPLRKLLFLNLLEDDLSKKYFKSMMWHFLDLCGYDIVKGNRDSENKFLSTEEELSNRIKLERNAINSVVPYIDIKIITEEKMKDINVQIKKNSRTPTTN
jgi:hypothetical protein